MRGGHFPFEIQPFSKYSGKMVYDSFQEYPYFLWERIQARDFRKNSGQVSLYMGKQSFFSKPTSTDVLREKIKLLTFNKKG